MSPMRYSHCARRWRGVSVEAEQSRTVKDGDNLDGIGPQAVHDSVVALNDLADGFVTGCSPSRVTAVKMRSATSSAR